MRRHRLVPMLALVLLLGACGTSTPAKPRTVTQFVTATGTAPTTAGSGGITVVAPSGSGAGTVSTPTSGAGTTGTARPSTTSGSTKPSTSATPSARTSATPATTAADKKVNPLHIACTSLLDSNDIKKALGATVSSASSRIVDVANPKVKMTGKVKCYYGVKTGSTNHPVTVALAQYASTGAAQTQMDVTASTEVSLGAQSSDVTVSGKKAHVLLRDGGLLVMRYDTWTLSVAVENKLVAPGKLSAGMATVATMVLARVLKNG